MNQSQLPKPKRTKRKFYHKWLFKISLDIKGYSITRYHNADYLEEFLNTPLSDTAISYFWSVERIAKENKDFILEFLKFLSTLEKDTYQTRIERNYVDFYTNDKSIYTSILKKYLSNIKQRYEPDDVIPVLEDIIYVKKYPYNKYKFKAYLKPHKLSKDRDGKLKYLKWLETQTDKIHITDATKDWFLRTDWNWDRRYIYINDEKTLFLFKIRNADLLGRIYEYRLLDK